MQAAEARHLARRVRATFSVSFSIYLLGTIGGVLVCLLEATRRVRFYNYSRLPLWEGNLILAANHPSWLDIVLVPLLYFPWWFRELFERLGQALVSPWRLLRKEPVNRTFTEEFKDIPVSTADKHNFRYFRWVLEGWNIFIDRRRDEIGERGGALKKAVEILANDGRVVIFPGGGRDFKAGVNGDGLYDARSGKLITRRPKAGIGWIVKQTGATIVPIRIDGTDRVLPNQPNEKLPAFLRFERYFLRVWHPVEIRIGEPLRFEPGTPEEIVVERFVRAQVELFEQSQTGKYPAHRLSPEEKAL